MIFEPFGFWAEGTGEILRFCMFKRCGLQANRPVNAVHHPTGAEKAVEKNPDKPS